MSNKYWQGFGEINDPENFQKKVSDEFREELPFEDFDSKGLLDAKAPRRDFLKYVGFSTAAATLAASCKTKVREAIPYAVKPENIIPGDAKYYATTFVQDGDVVPVLARTRDGRPILIEGNNLSFVKGCTTPRIQASVLDLYDKYRITHPKHKTGNKLEEIPTFEALDKAVVDQIRSAGGQVVLLSSTINSPSALQAIADFKAAYPNFKHVQYDAVSYTGMLLANEASFGKRAIPNYKFGNAKKVVVSIGADFLSSWLSPVEFQHGYALNRKINEANPQMSKHYQFESFLSMTGANADERFIHRESETGMVVTALAAAVGVAGVAAPAFSNAKLKAGIDKVAKDLLNHKGESLVVAGSNDVNIQLVVNAINAAIGAYGTTIDWSAPVNYRQGIDKDFADLLAEMEGGAIGTLMIYGANPVYTWPQQDRVKKALPKVKLKISFNEKLDETSEFCDYLVPTHHYLESWGDGEAFAGSIGFMQPTISPLFKTRQWQESLLQWAGKNEDFAEYFRNFWMGRLGGEMAYLKALQDGVSTTAGEAAVSGGAYSSNALATAVAAIAAAPKSSKKEIVLYQSNALGAGTHPANPWLHELPDPITKITWDNYAIISMALADELKIDYKSNDYEYYPKKPVVDIKVKGVSYKLPIIVVPGMDPNTIAVALGYGRTHTLGASYVDEAREDKKVGLDVYPLSSFNGTGVVHYAVDAEVSNTGDMYKLAQTQIHNSYEGRVEVVRETTMATFLQDKTQYKDYADKLYKTYTGKENATRDDFVKAGTMYREHEAEAIKWGMSIDMNACFGCGACVIACHAENNVPIVGKNEVMRYHDMHWLRIDRYYVSDEKDPNELKGVIFQPMMCQHCDNAPCENVCPVAATNHSNEGLNQMAYNRCIGTRYCANNCPYKVRRFNWLDYTGADSFPDNQDQTVVGKLDPAVFHMNDSLTRMVLNPDVTVRSRGVMEKCSMCVQRLQAAKLDAKKEGVPMKDRHIKLACSSACAADAIVFGNVKDPESAITKERENNPLRTFYVLEQLHVLPNVNYLAKIRNTDEIISTGDHHGGGEGHGSEGGHEAPGAHGAEKHEAAPAAEAHH
ncbi:TAT-variant-translocated molybdopterin oxidoreductase [Niabella insulamsoli]|uniref:TAT-variant-translocated molybdopterin oxidoreductase n=1 Tax=Niabella insulamsoli TaxID=3144874 RepID=UPI0031FDA7BC